MLFSIAIHKHIIFDLGNSLTALQHSAHPAVALGGGRTVAHDQALVSVKPPGCPECEQLLGSLLNLELVETVVHVQYGESIAAMEVVPQFLWSGYRFVSLIHMLVQRPAV